MQPKKKRKITKIKVEYVISEEFDYSESPEKMSNMNKDLEEIQRSQSMRRDRRVTYDMTKEEF